MTVCVWLSMTLCVWQIDEVLKDEKKADVMANHIDNLLVVITMQCKLGIGKHLMDTQVENGEVIRLYRCLLSTLISVSIWSLPFLVSQLHFCFINFWGGEIWVLYLRNSSKSQIIVFFVTETTTLLIPRNPS